MTRTRQQSALASPVLVGAVTVLVLIVAVFLAYNANQGLPFVPTRELRVDIADGSNLVIGNDVREGGFRIGLVSAMKPIELSNGQVGAQLTLQLDQANGKVPRDSRVTYSVKMSSTADSGSPAKGPWSDTHSSVGNRFPARMVLSNSAKISRTELLIQVSASAARVGFSTQSRRSRRGQRRHPLALFDGDQGPAPALRPGYARRRPS